MFNDFDIGPTAEEVYNDEVYNDEEYPFDQYDEDEVDVDIPQYYGGHAPWNLF